MPAASMPCAGLERWSLLALLRFALAAIVAINHLGEHADLGALAWVPRLGAFEAVLGFLLISGYSIGTSYRIAPDGFIVRRAWRLYPVYIGAMVLTWVVTPTPIDGVLFGVLLLNLLFLNQALTPSSFVGPAWSLSLEAWHYALTPAFARLSDRRLLGLALLSFLAFVAYTAGRTVWHWPYHAGLGYGLNLLTLSFPWLLGFLLARDAHRSPRVLQAVAFVTAGHWLLSVLIQLGSRLRHNSLDLFVRVDIAEFALRASTLTIVLGCLWCAARVPGSRRSPVLNLLGELSYPLYLSHIPVILLCQRFGIAQALPILFVMLMTAAAMHLVLERATRAAWPSRSFKTPSAGHLQRAP